ncbi:MAG: VWA domain-containing protein [Leptolyngbya sp. SIO4C1]|nr:VWA domain-containing protein [Leptolyngbya sp. SIO4C1]
MSVNLQWILSDAALDAEQTSSQRQLAIALSAVPQTNAQPAPLNLCLVLDRSGSMGGAPMQTVKAAAHRLVDRLSAQDRLSVVVFDHRAEVLISNQPMLDPNGAKLQIDSLRAGGGTAIDEGLKLGIEEVAKGKQDAISQIFLLTDGENEHGDDDRCLKLAQLATDYGLTVSTLGFGDHWNQDVIEKIADAGGGSLSYIQQPDAAIAQFSRLFSRIQTVALTSAYLKLTLSPQSRLAELKPIAQVKPEVVELDLQRSAEQVMVRLGDLMVDTPRVVLVNLYISQLPEGIHPIASIQVQYDAPSQAATGLMSERLTVEICAQARYQPKPNPQVQQHILMLAKYRQTKIAETKLQAGDRQGAATMLQSAAQTALQMGDTKAATVLQANATQLQLGKTLSERDRKQTQIVSKTSLR